MSKYRAVWYPDLYAIANDLSNVINGNLGNNSLYGLGGSDAIYGYDGDDKLDGGVGGEADTMVGGPGDDIYELDSAGDVVVEALNEGTDRLDPYLSLALPANVENLVLYGFNTNLNGTGNGLANIFNGSGGNNILSGLGGNDTLYGYTGKDVLIGGLGWDMMVGGADNDTYWVDRAGDQVIEAVGDGTDRVFGSVNYALQAGQEIERLDAGSMAGTTAINLSGNEFANSVYGNAADNVLNGGGGGDYLWGGDGKDWLNGGTGADRMVGGTGNDTYWIDNAGDRVIEAVGGGTDRVVASVNYALQAGQETERLDAGNTAGTTAINLIGNEFANSIVGNAADNVLNGGGGNDFLSGGDGNDRLSGGTGNDRIFGGSGHDRIVFATALDAATNVDRIIDFNSLDDRSF